MASTTQLTGLASGLDWRSLVDKLVAVERIPQTRLQSEKTAGAQKSAAIDGLKTKLTDLQTSLRALSGAGSTLFSARSAKLADATATWSLNAAAGTDTGSYVFNVTQLATKSQRTGVADAGAALSASSNVSGLTTGTLPIAASITEGDFTVNGAKVTVAATDSLEAVFTQISTATGGTVTGSYDPATDKIQLSSGSEIVLGSANDSSNFLNALQLRNNGTGSILAPRALGVVSVSAAISNANLRQGVTAVDASGNGSFQINGTSIAYNVNTDSLRAVISRINASAAGVTATFDKSGDRFTLTNKTTGDTGLAVSESAGGLLQALGLNTGSTLTRGQNAEFSIDGGETLTSTSNTLNEASTGITGLTLTANSQSTQTVTIGQDNSGVRTQIEDFLAKFNAVQSYVTAQTASSTSSDGKVTKATLTGNREVTDLAGSLRKLVFDAVPGLSGTVQRLESIGIDFAGTSSQLSIKDPSALDRALANQPDDVQTLFTKSTDGITSRLDTFLAKVTTTGGTLETQTQTIAKQSTALDAQIAAMERRITQQQSVLEASFVRMEQAQSQFQSQLAALNNAFGNKSSS